LGRYVLPTKIEKRKLVGMFLECVMADRTY